MNNITFVCSFREFCSADVYILPSEQQIVIVSHGSTGTAQLLKLGLELMFYIPGVMESQFDHFNGSVDICPDDNF